MRRYFQIPLQFLLSFCIVFSISLPSFILLSYEINKSEIIEKYCINKDKPALKCNGKCHMKDQLKTAENSKQEQDKSLPPLKEVNFHFWYASAALQWEFFSKGIEIKTIEKIQSENEGFPFINDPPPKWAILPLA